MAESMDGLLTYEEAALEVGIKLGSLKQVVNRGILHPIKIPGERRKFLRREDVVRYRTGKHGQRTISTLAASNSADPTPTSPTPSAAHQEEQEAFRFLTEVAPKALLANAEAYQASAEAYQVSTVAISEVMLGMMQKYFVAPSHTTDQQAHIMPRDTHVAQRYPKTPPKKLTSEDVVSLINQMREALARRRPLTYADEEAFQQLQDLFPK